MFIQSFVLPFILLIHNFSCQCNQQVYFHIQTLFFFIFKLTNIELEYLFETEYSYDPSFYSDQSNYTYWKNVLIIPETNIEPKQEIEQSIITEKCENQSQLNLNTLILLPQHELRKKITNIPPHYLLIINIGVFGVDVDFQQFYIKLYGENFNQTATFEGNTLNNITDICSTYQQQNCEYPITIEQSLMIGENYCGNEKIDPFFTISNQFNHGNTEIVNILNNYNIYHDNPSFKSSQLKLFQRILTCIQQLSNNA